ncbi:CopL family metal-binding regulatory protein [Lysobacter solisilvae (ex Woo and Kim 2020)]|uniref:CopL family metal-binding regulatory protein n=1 Tax=Agrilutibacter terrestris TaxID=2865112 RepID=A0A7H0G0C5_9GAMM|nr:CopL family metal-binding regulatory protein [Lysobacter terrestris]QNP41741.1 CopL family metal-binding regulatory protein [Lysobacter terrestris]
MPLWSFLLRFLLSLCLILNGTAALASAHLPLQDAVPAAMHASPTATDAMADMPCHHGEHVVAATDAQGDAHHPKDSGTTPDCCKSGACRCVCVHAAPIGVPALQLASFPRAHERSVRRLVPGHAAPALPHPIRPPIG